MKKLKRAAATALWIAALCACLLLADRAMRRDDGQRKYGNFFAEEQGFDVLFMGTSRVLDGVQPMELWRDYGVTSYNMGNNSENLETTKWVLDIAMDTHTPKVALIDVYYIDRKVTDAWAYSFRHLFLDEIPLTKKKIECVKATLPESEWTEFLMPFSLYHGRWEEILSGKTEEQVICRPFAFGAELRAQREKPGIDFVRTTEMNPEEMEGKDSLRKIAELFKLGRDTLGCSRVDASRGDRDDQHVARFPVERAEDLADRIDLGGAEVGKRKRRGHELIFPEHRRSGECRAYGFRRKIRLLDPDEIERLCLGRDELAFCHRKRVLLEVILVAEEYISRVGRFDISAELRLGDDFLHLSISR